MPRWTPLLGGMAVALTGCELMLGSDTPTQPTVASVDLTLDDTLDVVDRVALLTDATDDVPGAAPDLAKAPGAFFFAIDGSALTATLEERSTGGGAAALPTYDAVATGIAAVVVADVAGLAVVGPPAVGIAYAAGGQFTEHLPWLWSATNTFDDPLRGPTTLELTVAFVGAGWLAEMRVTNDEVIDEVWFDGFVGLDLSVGWWNLYDNGVVVGTVEWIDAGNGNAQSAIAAVGPHPDAGNVLRFLTADTGDARVEFYEATPDFLNYVALDADHSGEVALREVDGGAPQCWATDWTDIACP